VIAVRSTPQEHAAGLDRDVIDPSAYGDKQSLFWSFAV
jgi:hypothetical protein